MLFRSLIDEGKTINQTSAGQELNRTLVELTETHENELRDIQRRLDEAVRRNDEVSCRELEAEKKRVQMEKEKTEQNRERLSRCGNAATTTPRRRVRDTRRTSTSASVSSIPGDRHSQSCWHKCVRAITLGLSRIASIVRGTGMLGFCAGSLWGSSNYNRRSD